MAIKKRGDSTKLHVQPGSELDYEQDGLIRGQLVLEGDLAHKAAGPKVGARHPDEPLAFCYHRKLTKLPLSKIRWTCSYIGLERDPSDFVIELLGGMNQSPIDTHSKFVAQIGGTVGAPLNDAEFDTETGEFLGFPADAPHRLGGASAYLMPTVNLRRTYWTARIPDPKAMGDIIAKPGDIVLPPNVKNFLIGPMTYRSVGPVTVRLYQVSEEFLGSGPDGWNTKIYPV